MQSDVLVPKPQASRGLKLTGIVAALAAAGIVAAGAISREHDDATAQHWSDARAIPVVHLVGTSMASAGDTLTLPGTMQAWNDARIFAQVNGYVKDWYKDIGDQVGAGAALGSIQTPELDEQIVQARADVAKAKADAGLAKSTAARWDQLLSMASASKQEAEEKNGDLADKQASVQAAQANLDRLIAMKNFSVLRAPFAGKVTLRNAEIGDLVGPNAGNQQPIFGIADIHAIRVYVSIPQAYSAAIRTGATAALTVPDYPGRSFVARIVGDAGVVNAQSGSYQVQLIVDNPDHALRPGGYAQVVFDLPRRAQSLSIPSSTLIFRAKGTQVAMVGPGDRIRMRQIKLGQDLGGTVEVVSGLAAADRIVDNPPDSITDGELVRVSGNANG